MWELKEREKGFVLISLTKLLDQLMCLYQLDQLKDTGIYQVHTSLIHSLTHSLIQSYMALFRSRH